MEPFLLIIASAFVAYMTKKLEKMEASIAKIEDDVALVKHYLPKRKHDESHLE